MITAAPPRQPAAVTIRCARAGAGGGVAGGRVAAGGVAASSRPTRVWLVLPLLAVLLLLVAGCSRGAPAVQQVTVRAGTVSVTLPIAMSCSGPTGATALTCTGGETDKGAPHLRLAPGTPLDIDVPKDLGDTPWVVAFTYTDSAGQKKGDRSPVFAAGEQFSYHLQPPAGAQLTRLEVQSLIAAQAPSGGVEFPAVATWVLVIDPA